jgi:mRNA-degrading endonuclease toxin of MazEF toxin-antitoxin module
MAEVMYDDIPVSKIRPVLILDHRVAVLCLKMTTHSPRTKHDYQVTVLQGTGLIKDTVIRTDKMLRLSKENLIKRIGALQETDMLLLKIRHSVT